MLAPATLNPEGEVTGRRFRPATPPDDRVVRETPGIHLHRVALDSTFSVQQVEGGGGYAKENSVDIISGKIGEVNMVVGGEFDFGKQTKDGFPDFLMGFSIGDLGDLGRAITNSGAVRGVEGEGGNKIGGAY